MEKLQVLLRHPIFCNLFLLLVYVQACSNLAMAGSIVKFLPGFEGPLPFELETGYIGAGESEDVQLFYAFIKSESNPQSDPLIIWLDGGPGCSSFIPLFFGIGPVILEPLSFDGTLPKLVLNPSTWTKVVSIIFLDSPVGTGFSYAKTAEASQSSDFQASDQAYEFIRKWLHDHPEYKSNPFYVSGISYGGIPVPILTQLISNVIPGNEDGIEPRIDLKGYILGNPVTKVSGILNYRVPFAYGMGLISDELYESLKVNCKGEYEIIDPSNAACSKNMQAYNELVRNIDDQQILIPVCPPLSREPNKLFTGGRSIIQMLYKKFEELDVRESTPVKCRMEWITLVDHWANNKSVQEALHVRRETIGQWVSCSYPLPYTENAGSVVPYHANLSTKGYRSLIYSGDHDLSGPHIETQAWIRSLHYPIIDDWRQWIHEGQVAGYTRTYANKMTFATVKARNSCFYCFSARFVYMVTTNNKNYA
ncbi:serine carboxypeptidase-like 2 isoform X2 [Coffea eugenioides]|uniref:serine carboxypeptidase-like 2 isoform X2 n=1 Tax=Coffea eugenioides TaxID=49369 RepID=UPI000F60BA17|nr:serine carboxypeptidase-like 2 isoform X2 [Coffea eugenioides]